ncbi:MAG: hypothetical protein R6V03_10760 [Kiritimatiellia bacterium]
METVEFNGWTDNIRLANKKVELIITRNVGPRVIRFGYIGEKNVLGEIPGQQGGMGEDEWMIRGGHRLWIAPEEKPKSYELDNTPIEAEEIPGGVKTVQPPGPITGIVKSMEIALAPDSNVVTVDHILTNNGEGAVEPAPWALSVMCLNGTAVIPLPHKIPHTERLTHNQEWSLWGYTDFSDPRWTIGRRYVTFRQDPYRGPNKLGIAHSEGWAGYYTDGFLFIKRFAREKDASYPDGGVNFETFANEEFLEMESIGSLVTLKPGESARHRETWSLHRDVPEWKSEDDIDRDIKPLAR